MNPIILALALFFISITSSVVANEGNELFSLAERSEVIRSIDDICGDTWCEGDYNFKFSHFSCDKTVKTCDLGFFFIKNNEQSVEVYSPIQTCHFSDIHYFHQIKDSKFSLNQNFYDKLTNCIGARENEIQF